jgi:hypothetical protein
MDAPEPPFTTKERQPTPHSLTGKELADFNRCFTASQSIQPGNAVHVEMWKDGLQTGTIGGRVRCLQTGTIGSRVRWHNQNLFLTATQPFKERPSNANAGGEKEVPSEDLFHTGHLYYSPHFVGHPELDYALIQPEPDVQMLDDVELFPSPCHAFLELPRFVSEEDFGKRKRRPVRLATASAGEVNGVLNCIPCFREQPGASEPQRIYCVETGDLLAPGDVGAWVFDACGWDDSRDSLLGHIVEWDAEAEVALLVPAYQVFADLARLFAKKPHEGR